MKKNFVWGITFLFLFSSYLSTASAVVTSSSEGIYLETSDVSFTNAQVSPDGKYIYATGSSDQSPLIRSDHEDTVVKIDSSSFEIVDSYTIEKIENDYRAFVTVLSPDGKFLYVGGYNTGEIVKIKTSDFSLVSRIQTDNGYLLAGAITKDGSTGYFGTDYGYLIKVDLTGQMSVVSEIQVGTSDDHHYSIALNSDATIGYLIGTHWSPDGIPSMFAVNLSGDMEIIQDTQLNPGDGYIQELVLTSNTKGWYLGVPYGQVKLYRVDLSSLATDLEYELSEEFTSAGSITLSFDKKSVYAIVAKPSGEINQYETHILQINLSDGEIIKNVTLPVEQSNSFETFINPNSGEIYINFFHVWNETQIIYGSGLAVATSGDAAAKPTAPKKLAVAYASKKATFTWQAPAKSGPASITHYLYCFEKCNKDASWKKVTELKYVKTGLAKGTKGTFQVRAVTHYGKGAVAEIDFKQTK